uniref:Uncharacterized protein n=1 Tax=Meloidogyne javanica TaxID=6303 RepID=A0A915M4Q0_MELJA
MAARSSSDVGQYDIIYCDDIQEVKILLKLFIGNDEAPRWVEIPHDDNNKKYFSCSCSECIMELIACFDELCIKVTDGEHNHEGEMVDEELKLALHLI